MGKTPKKAAPGGDERNLYVRRLKATTTASSSWSSSSSSSSKSCETNVAARQRESENPNRSKPIGVQKRLPVPTGKAFKSKLRTPAKTKTHEQLKNSNNFQSTTITVDKTSGNTKNQDSKSSTMHSESEEAAVQLKVSITKKEVPADVEKPIETDEALKKLEETSENPKNTKESIPSPEPEATDPQIEKNPENIEKLVEESSLENSNESAMKDDSEINENENRTSEDSSSKSAELKLENSVESVKLSEKIEESCETNGKEEESIDKTDNKEETEHLEKAKTMENCSVVESTTSEISEIATEMKKTRESGNPEKESLDASFVSYDSSIMLKDVQIKLNDCLKDNSKLFDVSNDENSAEHQKRLDMSFGKTLRNISGRNSINRLRYVTLREHRFSPNSSLFVNTSSVSVDPEDSVKSTNFSSASSDVTVKFNGNPAERKRKLVTDVRESVKKLKIDRPERTNSFFNSSIEMLNSFRRPIQMSTPNNNKGYAFDSEKYKIKNFSDDDKLMIDSQDEPRKWCVVM